MTKHYPNVNDTTKRDRKAEPQAVWTFSLKRRLVHRNPLYLIDKPTPSMRIHHVPPTVAKLMGHSSTKMLYTRYGKWLESGPMDVGANAGLKS